MDALTLLKMLKYLESSATIDSRFAIERDPRLGSNDIASIPHLILQRGVYYLGQSPPDTFKKLDKLNRRMPNNRLHADLAMEAPSLQYVEGYRFDTETGEFILSSWCTLSKDPRYAIDARLTDDPSRFGYIGLRFEKDLLVQETEHLKKNEELWLLPIAIAEIAQRTTAHTAAKAAPID